MLKNPTPLTFLALLYYEKLDASKNYEDIISKTLLLLENVDRDPEGENSGVSLAEILCKKTLRNREQWKNGTSWHFHN